MSGSNKEKSTAVSKYLNFSEAVIAIGVCFIGIFYILGGLGNSLTMLIIGVVLLAVGLLTFKYRKKITTILERKVNKHDL